MPPSETQAPFVEPYAKAGNPSGFKSKGNTALAVKRAMAHLGFIAWEPDRWDAHWNETLSDAVADWKAKRGLIPVGSNDGSWGENAHSTMRGTWYGPDKLPAFDGESQRLLQEEKRAYDREHPPPTTNIEAAIRKEITAFCEQGIAEPDWYYSQARAIDVEVSPNGPTTSDCSGSAIQIFWYARKRTGANVPDPAQQGWSGYGNTNYYEDDWPTVTNGQYLVGDLAHYDGHVCVCYHPGDSNAADWWSFGSEPPSKRKLYYRSDFRKVVRPRLVA